MASDPVLLLTAAADRAALVESLRELRRRAAAGDARLTGAGSGHERVAIVAEAAAMPAAIDAALDRLPSLETARLVQRQTGVRFTRGASPGGIAFVFPGQGSEHAAMLRALRARSAVVSGWFDAMDAAAISAGDARPSRLLDAPDADAPTERQRRLIEDRETSAQLGSVAALALHDLLSALGVRADVHVGHSNGEHPAVIAAGRIGGTQEEICRGFVEIGRISARLARPDRERMVALSLGDRDRLVAAIDRAGVYFAMDNCPGQIVAGGEAARIDALARDVVAAGGVAMTLPFSRAYHTPLFVDQAEAFGAYYRTWRIGAGSEDPAYTDVGRTFRSGKGEAVVPVWSCFDEAPIPDDPDACRRVMTAQWTSRVQFRTTIERLHASGVRTFVEVGPDARLTAFVEDTLRGRPHVALSTSSIHRGDVEQILHLLADLFVAGVAVDPDRLAAVLPQRGSSIANLAIETHRRLIDEANGRLARMAALVGAAAVGAAAVGAAAVGAAAVGADAVGADAVGEPLAGSIVASTSARVELARTFTRQADPFVDDHALGRRHASDPAGSYPLPVLPFTASLEIVAETARAFGCAAVTEIRDARASRWLALDRGRLEIGVTGERREGGVRVSITAQGDERSAFDATVALDAAAARAIDVPRDPAGVPPRAWSASRFYDDYAFHLGAFRALERIDAVGPRGVEATLEIGRLRGLAANRLIVDPAMLDCAGQLVAFWLLEHEGQAPTFGAFPFAARSVVVHAPPPARGSRVHARAWITRRSGVTSADVAFTAADGGPIVTVQRFMQRIVAFPEWFARRVFAGDPSALPACPSADDRTLIETSWGIWARVLAHLSMTPAELSAWYASSSRTERLFWARERPQLEAGWTR